MPFSFAEFLSKEMKANNWTTDDVADRMDVAGFDDDSFSISTILVYSNKPKYAVGVSDEVYEGLSRAFDVDVNTLKELQSVWGSHAFYPIPAEFYGPRTKDALVRRKERLRLRRLATAN